MVDCTTADGTVVELWTGNGGANQAWTSTGAGELQVSIGGATKCLDASGGGTANGTADGAFTELWDCKPAGSNNRNWTPGGGSAPAGRMAAPYLYEGWGNPPRRPRSWRRPASASSPWPLCSGISQGDWAFTQITAGFTG